MIKKFYLCPLKILIKRTITLNRMKNILLGVILAVTFVSCSPFNQLLKSNNSEAKYKEAFRLYEQGKYNKAFTLFDNALAAYIGSPREDTISFMMGKTAYQLKDYIVAGQMMDKYRSEFTRSKNTIEAEYIVGMSSYHMSLDAEKDQSETKRALNTFHEFISRHPESQYVEQIEKLIEELTAKLYEKTYLNAVIYYKLGHYQSAVTSLRSALREFPEIPQRQEMMFMVCKSWFSYAQNSIYQRQLDRYLKMIDAYYNFKTSYPSSEEYDKELDRMLAIAQKFTQENGVMSQAIETTTTKLDKTLMKIEENKNKIFFVEKRAERQALKADNKELRATAKELKQTLKKEKKSVKNNETKIK